LSVGGWGLIINRFDQSLINCINPLPSIQLYPFLIASLMSTSGNHWSQSSEENGSGDFLVFFVPALLILFAFRLARTGFAQPQQLYVPLLVTCLIHSDRFGYMETTGTESTF
jgi:hypothetical protein